MAEKKGLLHLSVDNNLVKLAKDSGLNLSNEFEQWLKVRLEYKNNNLEQQHIDPALEIAKRENEIIKYKEMQNQQLKEVAEDKEIEMIIDNVIDNMIEYKEDLVNVQDNRINGLQFLLRKKLNKVITYNEAKTLLTERIKERNLCQI